MTREKRLSQLTPYLFLILPLIIYLIWVIGPMFYTFYLSLTNWDGVSTPDFIGLRNYQRLFKDPVFYISLKNNLKWILSFITIPVVAGLALAMALNRSIPGAKAFKASFYSPLVLSLVVCGLIWGWMYQPANGLINATLRAVGLGALARGWLSDKNLVMWAIIAVGIWRQVGYVMVLYLAGLQGVDPGLIDASKVDGCSGWLTFRHVIFPLLTPVTVIVVVISIIDSLRAFDLVSVMTRGGPYNSSSVLANFMYIQAFNNYKMGYGAAISVVLFLISLVFIFIYLWRVLQTEMEY
ncbi:MAG TPA: sugar ABC transporter permease [Chloroflexi bacterium]|nr:sugar ABC transporter permease [Chloroflexota bacterium]